MNGLETKIIFAGKMTIISIILTHLLKIASIYGKAHKSFSKHAIESSRNGALEMEVTKNEF